MTPVRPRLLPLFEVVTVGWPFAAFKILFGGVLVRQPGWEAAGWGLIALGVVDGLLNVIAFVAMAAGRPSPLGVCSCQQLVITLRSDDAAWRELGLALDTMVSFTVVALMIGLHLISRLTPVGGVAWNVSVICNVLGAGAGRLATSVAALRQVAARGPS